VFVTRAGTTDDDDPVPASPPPFDWLSLLEWDAVEQLNFDDPMMQPLPDPIVAYSGLSDVERLALLLVDVKICRLLSSVDVVFPI
jgi:hypothetical protein